MEGAALLVHIFAPTGRRLMEQLEHWALAEKESAQRETEETEGKVPTTSP